MKETFIELNEYNSWSYKLLLKAVRALPAPSDSLLAVFGHAVIAEHVWLRRMQGAEDPPPPVWPDMNLDEIESQIEHNRQAMAHYIAELPVGSFAEGIQYTNSKGDRYQNILGDILMHVHLHAGYHRGQINKLIRQEGGEPAIVDYIAYKRAQPLQS